MRYLDGLATTLAAVAIPYGYTLVPWSRDALIAERDDKPDIGARHTAHAQPCRPPAARPCLQSLKRRCAKPEVGRSVFRSGLGDVERMMIVISLLLIAAGAIFVWAVNTSVSGVELDVVGWILILVGAFGVVASLLLRIPERRRDVVNH